VPCNSTFQHLCAFLPTPLRLGSAALRQVSLEEQRDLGVVMYGTPDQVAAQIKLEYERIGGFDHLLMMMQRMMDCIEYLKTMGMVDSLKTCYYYSLDYYFIFMRF
jgi:hypothetical protein